MNLNILVKEIKSDYLKPSASSFKIKTGQNLRVNVFIQEGDKKRIQPYTGVCVRQHKAGLTSTITVRKWSKGIGVERIFPIHSPDIPSMEPVATKKKGSAKASIKY